MNHSFSTLPSVSGRRMTPPLGDDPAHEADMRALCREQPAANFDDTDGFESIEAEDEECFVHSNDRQI